MRATSGYNEALLHWLWKNRHLQSRALATTAAQKIIIHHPGYPNPSDGPDFINARITIGGLMWHGDVEIHWRASHWRHHKHHTDANYNRVILHVVYDEAKQAAYCQDGSCPPTLQMKPFLSKSLQYFFNHFQESKKLACAGNINTVPAPVIHEQFKRAHRAYFEQKIDDLLQYYDASLPLSQAWRYMLITALFDGLGISHNRKPMRRLAGMLLQENEITARQRLIKKALATAGIKPRDPKTKFCWKRKGSRPANHPESRIPQACEAMHFIQNQPFAWWLRTDIESSFDTMLQQIDTTPGIGSRQSGVLLGTVWIPAFYLLGDFTGTNRLQNQANEAWENHRTQLPGSITKHFNQTDMPKHAFAKKLGTVHQYRTYCKPRRCEQCNVFNFIISP